MTKLKLGIAAASALLVLGFLASPAFSETPTLTVLHSFDGADGAYPEAGLVQATNGYMYGVTWAGGANGEGTIFRITPSGAFTTLYSFCSLSGCADGASPYGNLIQATNGDLYGMTAGGGNNNNPNCDNTGLNGCGTIFKITPSGGFTTLHAFCSQSECADGYFPIGALVQADNGDLYGTTSAGGADFGTIFKITPSGTFTTVYNFCHEFGCPDGQEPYGGLALAGNGDLYGLASGGGANGWGTIFKITPGGVLTTLYSFCSQTGCADGGSPYWGLVQANNGSLYGTTAFGGANNYPPGYGTLFEVTPSGALTTLYSFCSQPGCTDGYSSYGGLMQATDKNVYGATYFGGANSGCIDGCGTLYRMTPSGAFSTIYNFCSQPECTDGAGPYGALVQYTNGALFGATYAGGANGYGTVFKLAAGLGRFVEARPNIGKVGATITILGSLLSGATSVSFNHIAASFTVVSANEITAVIPDGATTGEIRVIVPGGVTLLSNKFFEIVQ
jgi:uncharacterized repeat protein (TIGR03803 family)